jgi:patatin-related protein
MREKELRIALVCFGGVSLAVYMHGVSKEVLKVVRASRALHAKTQPGGRDDAVFDPGVDDPRDPEHDTEAIWFALLQEIGRSVDLRVIVDIVAGASAGGINGTMLARALAHDLPIKTLRDLWLDRGDVEVLLDPKARAGPWSKVFMRPFLWGVAAARRIAEIGDPEVRRKLSLFVRSRWFKPPFDGERMTQLMYDAILSMGSPFNPAQSLLPDGHRLELFVTVTDFHGYRRTIAIHDPPAVDEREHERTLRFSYERLRSGDVASDFDLENAPALAFAARATSSFPGAFPPARLAEMDAFLARRGLIWRRRDDFLARGCNPALASAANTSETTFFIDGSVLNDKPFREAIRAVRGRPAQREVDRRLVYIDPIPESAQAGGDGRMPGFFSTLRSALSDIPRNEPIANELDWITEFNNRVRRRRAIIDAARPHVTELVSEILPQSLAGALAAEQVGLWREAASSRAASEAGFAYEGYVRLKLAAVRSQLAQMISGLLGFDARSDGAQFLAEVIDRWADAAGIVYARAGSRALGAEGGVTAAVAPSWIRFLLAFDVEFRKRRLHFLIQGQNRLREALTGAGAAPVVIDAINALKSEFHVQLDALRRRERPMFFSNLARSLANEIFAKAAAAGQRHESGRLRAADRGAPFAAGNAAQIRQLVARMGEELDLDSSTRDLDRALATVNPAVWPEEARREALVNHLGFAFWDVLTLSVTNWRDAAEFDEILVDRISPEDARTLKKLGAPTVLKGVGLMHFAAFFSRAFRENDYLLGRLQAADRLVDLVCDCAGPQAVRGVDLDGFRLRLFARILKTEEPHLPNSAGLMAELRSAFAKMA